MWISKIPGKSSYLRLKEQGFEVVEHQVVTAENMQETVQWFAGKIQANDFPSDGLVLLYDDIAYGDSLARTAKFPRNSIAFKWQDETEKTHLLEMSRMKCIAGTGTDQSGGDL